MKLILDTNVIISGLVKRSITLFKIIELYTKNFEILIPEYVKDEVESKIDKISKASGLSYSEIKYILDVLFRMIKIVPKDVFIGKWEDAYRISKSFDVKDTPFIALALKLNIPIWTGDKKMIEFGLKTGNYMALDTKAVEDLADGKSLEDVLSDLKKRFEES